MYWLDNAQIVVNKIVSIAGFIVKFILEARVREVIVLYLYCFILKFSEDKRFEYFSVATVFGEGTIQGTYVWSLVITFSVV